MPDSTTQQEIDNNQAAQEEVLDNTPISGGGDVNGTPAFGEGTSVNGEFDAMLKPVDDQYLQFLNWKQEQENAKLIDEEAKKRYQVPYTPIPEWLKEQLANSNGDDNAYINPNKFLFIEFKINKNDPDPIWYRYVNEGTTFAQISGLVVTPTPPNEDQHFAGWAYWDESANSGQGAEVEITDDNFIILHNGGPFYGETFYAKFEANNP
jgi:hypothetical protein